MRQFDCPYNQHDLFASVSDICSESFVVYEVKNFKYEKTGGDFEKYKMSVAAPLPSLPNFITSVLLSCIVVWNGMRTGSTRISLVVCV